MAAIRNVPSFTTFGEMLRYLRRRERLSQRELAIAVGYSESMVSRLEHDDRPPDVATLHALFVPALKLEDQPELVARMIELANATRGKVIEGGGHTQGGGEENAVPVRHHLPIRLTSFVGRAEDVQAAMQKLAQGRLVTLTGPGGCGKTSLAIETARKIAESTVTENSRVTGPSHRLDAIYLVELLPLADPSMLAQSILTALALEGNTKHSPQQTLTDFLANDSVLLILDNCEHLVGQVASLAEALLRACPRLRIVTTSRERLNIGPESVYVVQPLAFPGTGTRAEFGEIAACPAVQLFLERAKTVTPDLHLTEQNADHILRICELLDGMPLALELGAAATATFSVAEIAGQLDARLLMASPGYRTADPRHYTLRNTVEWSYRLLAPAEQRMLIYLAVFVGGWTLEAMQEVAGRDTDSAALLQQFVSKSLVRVEEVGGQDCPSRRYQLLRAIREFAAELLTNDDEQDSVRRRHFDYYARLAVQLGNEVLGIRHRQATAELDIEYYNIRTAAQYALGKPALTEMRLRLAAALPFYWQLRSPSLGEEGITWLDGVDDSRSAISIISRAQAYTALLDIDGLNLYWDLEGERIPPTRPKLVEAADALVDQCLAQDDKHCAARLLLALAAEHRSAAGLSKCKEYVRRAVKLLDEVNGAPRDVGFACILSTWLNVVEGRPHTLRAQQDSNFQILNLIGSPWALCEAYRLQVTLADLAHDDAEQIYYLKLLIALAEREEFANHLHRACYILEHIDEGLAMQIADELLERQRGNSSKILLGLALHQVGRMCVNTQQFERAATILDEAIEYWRRDAGELGGCGSALQWSLLDRGRAAYFLGDNAMAIRCYDESIAIFAASSSPRGGGFPQLCRGYIALATGDLRGAERYYRLCLHTVTQGSAIWEKLAIRALAALAELAASQKDWVRAGRLFGTAAMQDAAGTPNAFSDGHRSIQVAGSNEPAANQPSTVLAQPSSRARFGEVFEYSRAMAAAAEYRSNPTFEAAWQEGARMTLAEAVAKALEV